ncbi:class I adenylate-forming enzyme family protein [uncultured Tessaracoccus sp.]|uniref:AMP-binding protein n=1 Tax=uncultured Tessaracoccus sp. TaxID=905023 RepID=UPI002637AA52|nr:class I adenylate-forming enzyme family protein [uncultured Tessaracoccus sp.]
MSELLLQRVLDGLADRPDDPAFLGLDRISRAEFADLVRTYAGGLRKRKARNFVLMARPGPASFALALAAVGMGVRIDLISPKGGTELVQSRLEETVPDFVVAEPGLRFLLKGPGWLRRPAGLPDWRIWPEIISIDDVGGAQVRRYGVEEDQSALTVFTSGTTSHPVGVVHTAGSLSAGAEMVSTLFDADAPGPVMAGTFFAMLPAYALGKPIVLPARNPRRLAGQLRKWRPSHTYLTPPQWRAALAAGATTTGRVFAGSATVTANLLSRLRAAGADEAWGVYAMTEVFPAAVIESRNKLTDDARGDHVGRLFDGVDARIEDDEIILSGRSMAPRCIDGAWRDDVATGDLGVLEGRELWLQGRRKDMILRGTDNIYPGLYEPRLTVEGVDVALLLGVPADDGDEELALLVDAGARSDKLRGVLQRRARELGLVVDHIIFDTVPTSGRSNKPDRQAARALVQQHIRKGQGR